MDYEAFERLTTNDFSPANGEREPQGLFGAYKELTSAHVADLDVQLIADLRKENPELIVTYVAPKVICRCSNNILTSA